MDNTDTADFSAFKTFDATFTKGTAADTERAPELTSRTTETVPLFGDGVSQTYGHHTGRAEGVLATTPSSAVNSPVDDGEDAISNKNNDRGRSAACCQTMRVAATWMTRTFCSQFLREMANFIQQCCSEMIMDEGE